MKLSFSFFGNSTKKGQVAENTVIPVDAQQESQQQLNADSQKQDIVPDVTDSKVIETSDAGSNDISVELTNQENSQEPVTAPVTPPSPQSSQVIVTEDTAFAFDNDEWIIVGASVTGNGHISLKLPCQDNHKYEYLGKGWGIAITSDGAGSAENSHIGSKLVAKRGIFHFQSLIEREGWITKNELPSDSKWQQLSYYAMKAVRNDLDAYSKAHDITLKSLSATAIVVVHSPIGILATHIGDGRAGYKNENGEWKNIIAPHKGEEANQTIFLSSDFWDIHYYVMSKVFVPEAVVVREKPFAFTLMSDGCESTAWLYNQKDEKTGHFFDPNVPFPDFFNPLCNTLHLFHNEKVGLEERKEKWKTFITSGTKSFEREQDDKTMILGVLNK